ncbi:ActS/PrrB/RegB family redox-sensitive histidine kinase [Alsobacter sp. SYSU M60028]|uniref:histidine kinase n=1 Tax=Alsobacter ponti TaxID=2962936 RepID=A0ABT1LF16_9HYPH|nr:ActS/PrrB/RegB family redox-sensitive histidine kinase [Alsobacter ponti]MCP8938838.1 ActS/PrrB/RegB family redox-sensitive histidine kinase [Alsobacter ponti]
MDFRRSASRLRLRTLVRLRWLAIAGQTIALVAVKFGLGFDVPLAPCLAVVAVSAGVNLWLTLRFPAARRLDENAATALLAFDIVELAGLLYLTGGLENPFAILFLAPVMVAAASLPPARTFALGGLVMAAATVLVVFHLPLPWAERDTMTLPPLYQAGVWTALLLALAFLGLYARRVAEEARQLVQGLAATELVLAREQHLSQLDGLAAAAAHELGTPLATIALVARELRKAVPEDGPLAEDVALLGQQAERCRDILLKLTSMDDEEQGPLDRLPLGVLIEEVAGPRRAFRAVESRLAGEGPEPVCRRNPGMLYGLGNLVENAVDFARETVRIEARWDAGSVTVAIADDGPGFSGDVLSRLGEPYVTTRRDARAGDARGGLGLGLFIAKTLLERTGATLDMRNGPAGGATVRVTWPREAFERTPQDHGPASESAFRL